MRTGDLGPGTPFRALFDAFPTPLLIVDADVRILDANAAARRLLDPRGPVLAMRGGEALHCLHATESNSGCGHSASCGDCVVRCVVGEALSTGEPVRRNTRMLLLSGEEAEEVFYQVGASPLELGRRRRILLSLEDIGEMVRLNSILPMCAWCKKIRNDRLEWESLEGYFTARLDVFFSHALCPDCFRERMDEPVPLPSRSRGTAG